VRILDPMAAQPGRVPLPKRFPGDFFVLEYDRDGESYILTLGPLLVRSRR